MVLAPAQPKIYHIVHVDRLASILQDGAILCDATVAQRRKPGTSIGMTSIKQRRLKELMLKSCPGLFVGECVHFYFCPRSVMLYRIEVNRHNDPELDYWGGQEPIIHLEADLNQAVEWANRSEWCWAFTTSNAGAYNFEDYASLPDLDKIDWAAVNAFSWQSVRNAKQAEFLVEREFPWKLISRIGVQSYRSRDRVQQALRNSDHRPTVQVMRNWYY